VSQFVASGALHERWLIQPFLNADLLTKEAVSFLKKSGRDFAIGIRESKGDGRIGRHYSLYWSDPSWWEGKIDVLQARERSDFLKKLFWAEGYTFVA
jgi:hypothetical protein